MTSSVPRLVELDDASLGRQRTRVGPWLTTVAGLQTAFRRLLGDTVRMVGDPLASGWLSGMHERAREHEARVDDLFAAFELDRPGPPALTALAGAVLGRTREAVGQLQGLLAG